MIFYFGELFEVCNSFCLFAFILPFLVEVDELIGILPVGIEDAYAHYILSFWVVCDFFSSEVAEDVCRRGTKWPKQICLQLCVYFVF